MPITVDRPPPPVETPARGGGSGWVELIKAKHDIDAHLLAGRLMEAGVEVSTFKDRSSPSWLYGGANPWAPVTILVRRFQLDDARLVLAEISFEAPAAEQAPVEERSIPYIWWALALGLGVLLTATGLAQTQRAIEVCDLPILCSDKAGEGR
ncbi:MAG: DUF2007 domain-containing protein [Actinomycetota bacterium]|nr:DUF2007 domain-containing protein [Actinomycetota bacterium]